MMSTMSLEFAPLDKLEIPVCLLEGNGNGTVNVSDQLSQLGLLPRLPMCFA